MPSQRPRASFEPLPPDIDMKTLVEETPHFQFVDRISCDMIDTQGMAAFDKLVLLHVVIGGKPLVIDGYQDRLDPWAFSSKWLQDNHGDKVESARELTKKAPLPLTVGHYLRNMGKLADQFFENAENYKDTKERQRLYLKDIDCPPVWQDKLRSQLPPNLFYLNESTGDLGGPGAIDESAPTGGRRKGKGVAPAGDLMSSLPPAARADNLMCYIGHEGTYTPAHREMCASLGHNIMVEASDIVGDDGKAEKPGSAVWFMTESKDRKTVQEYWLSILGHDIETENHFAQIAAWKQAPFTVYVVEQRTGDFILIPPLAPHQVWNRGTRTMKVAWNRTSVETLELALHEALPNARLVCRDEQYKNKAIIYFTLQKYSALLARARDQQQTAPSPQEAAALRSSPKIRQLQKDFKRLFKMFREILLSEMYAPETSHEKNVQFMPYEGFVTCAYCRGNIFNRFLTCSTCEYALGTTEPEPYDVCMECYAMGRSCGCVSKLRWVEQFKWKELTHKYEQWRRQFIDLDGGQRSSAPLPLQEERQRLTKKTLAQICQEQLKRRPWVDISKPVEPSDDDDSGEEIQYNADGTIKAKKKRRSEAWLKAHKACHVCCHRHEAWKMFGCKCGRWWCYGTLFRGFDTMPQIIMEDPSWECPHCRGVCIAGNCRKDPRQKPYEPKGTLLGHDTRKVADVRSTESLVDFSVSNLNYLKETVEAPANNARLWRRAQEADRDKLNGPHLDERYALETDAGVHGIDQIEYDVDSSTLDPRLGDGSAIDPALGGNGAPPPAQLRQTHGLMPSMATLLNGAHSQGSADEDPMYQAASQHGFVAPQAVMFQPETTAEEEAESDTMYPELDDNTGSEPARNKKRKGASDATEIKRQPARKRRRPENETASEATKQFRREQERRSRDEARRQGRYIQFMAALRGLSRIVKLPVGRSAAMSFRAKEAEQQAADEDTEGNNNDNNNNNTSVLLRSDVLPPHTSDKQSNAIRSPGSKATKSVRVRVERDEDFGTRRRDRERAQSKAAKANSKKKESQTREMEEVDIGSDSEVDDDQEAAAAAARGAGAVETTDAGSRRRRISAWQARRHEGDADVDLESLPNDWKDGRGARRKNPTAGAGTPERPVAGGKSAPSSAQIRPSQVTMEEEEEDEEGAGIDALRSEGGRASHRPLAAAAAREADDAAKRWSRSEAVELPAVKGVASSYGGSVTARGTTGRKVKIVSGSMKQQQQQRQQQQQQQASRGTAVERVDVSESLTKEGEGASQSSEEDSSDEDSR